MQPYLLHDRSSDPVFRRYQFLMFSTEIDVTYAKIGNELLTIFSWKDRLIVNEFVRKRHDIINILRSSAFSPFTTFINPVILPAKTITQEHIN